MSCYIVSPVKNSHNEKCFVSEKRPMGLVLHVLACQHVYMRMCMPVCVCVCSCASECGTECSGLEQHSVAAPTILTSHTQIVLVEWK